MIDSIYKKSPNIDLLNEFYSEFVKYSNTDGRSLGIVLTPPHIVETMAKMLNINENDTVLDLCTGTGSYLLESYKYKPKMIIGCEYQNKLYTLLKCNMIIRNIDQSKYNIILGDCFENSFKCTKSLINPPYGMKDKKELEFILKQIESLEDGGEACAIIPISKITNNPTNNEFKKEILNQAHIKNIILCRDTLFYPNASVSTCIIHLKKINLNSEVIPDTNNNLTSIIDYSNDGFYVKKQSGIIKGDEYENNLFDLFKKINLGENLKVLNFADDWNLGEITLINQDQDLILHIKLKELEAKYEAEKQLILNSPAKILPFVEYKNIPFFDIFKIVNGKSIKLIDCKNIDQGYNVISSSQFNNSIHRDHKFPTFHYNGNCLTLNKNGSVGYCFYQKSPFVKTCDIYVLESLEDVNERIYNYFSIILTKICTSRFNYSYKINNERLLKLNVKMPINTSGDINYEYIESLYDA